MNGAGEVVLADMRGAPVQMFGPLILPPAHQHSIWNQISIGIVSGNPSKWALSVREKFYGMARPSFRRRRLAGSSGGGRAMAMISVLGVDLGKNVCSVIGLDASGAVVMRRKTRRATFIALAEKLPPCVVGMEACCGAHHLGRGFAAHGHEVRLMSPEYVRPYVKAQKNDDRDAEGIAEAATRPTMRFVELKSQDQLDMQTLHRSRDRLVGERTALINQLRAILLERGFVAPQGKRKLAQFLIVLMDEQGGADLSPRIALLVADARAQWAELDRRVAAFDAEFVRRREGERCGPSTDDDPRLRRDCRVGACRRRRSGGKLRPRPRSCGLARPSSSTVRHRRQAEALGHQQARQQLSAQTVDPRSPRGAALCG